MGPQYLSEDLKANRGHPKEQALLVSLRISQAARRKSRTLGRVVTLVHRVFTELLLGAELRPETKIGPGLRVFHGQALVVNTATVIGAGVKLHHSVTLGLRQAGGGAPVLEDGVEVGAGAIILGPVVIGAGARIGAGAVVLDSIPAGRVAVGNPARLL